MVDNDTDDEIAIVDIRVTIMVHHFNAVDSFTEADEPMLQNLVHISPRGETNTSRIRLVHIINERRLP